MTTALRKLLERNEMLVLPGAYDALIAKIIEKVGFEAMCTTGFGIAGSMLGKPDVGLYTMTESLECHRAIANAVTIPVLADADNGHGNAINVMRMISEFEKAGIAGVYMEDQVSPKRCGRVIRKEQARTKEVVSMDEMIGKIKAAMEARDDPDFVIVARSDAELISRDEVIKRLTNYRKAGADLVMPICHTVEDYGFYPKYVDAPLLTHISTLEMELTANEIREMGYKVCMFPLSAIWVVTKAVLDLMQDLKAKGETKEYLKKIDAVSMKEFFDFIGLPAYKKLEDSFLPLNL